PRRDARPAPHAVPRAQPRMTGLVAWVLAAAAGTPPAPAPGSVVRTEAAGGWMVQLAGEPGHLDVQEAGSSPATGRTMLLVAATSSGFDKLVASNALLLGTDGSIARSVALGGVRPIAGDLSPDGKVGA